MIQQITNALDGTISGRVCIRNTRIECIVSLSHEDSSHPLAPAVLYGGEKSKFVVHHHIVIGMETICDVVKLLFLVHVNQDVSINCSGESRTIHLVRLKHHIAVGENDNPAPLLKVLDDVECIGEKAIGEWIFYEEARNGQQAQIVRIADSKNLQGTQVICVTEPGSQLLENCPIAPCPFGPNLLIEIAPKVGNDLVVVEQRVVNVEQEDEVGECGFQG